MALPRSRLVCFLALVPALLAAQGLPRARPGLVGMSSARVARLRQMLQAYVDSGQVAGAVAIVLRRGRVVVLDTVGWADRDARIPMRSHTIFRIASMSKPITSVGAMILIEEGKLSLDDAISKYLPAFRNERVLVAAGDSAKGTPDSLVPAARPITVHDLLTHRSGITYAFEDDAINVGYYRRAGIADGFGGGEGTIAATAEKIAAQPLAFQPGTKRMYGLNADVLGRVMEVASGMPLDRFLTERVLRPLRMDDTYFYVPDDKVARIAVPYTVDSAQHLRVMDAVQRVGSVVFAGRGSRGSRTYFSGGAGLYSTAPDYARFLQMVLNGGQLGGVRILSPKTVELMTANATSDLSPSPLGPGVGFGLGFAVVTDIGLSGRYSSVGQLSWGGVYGSSFWADPKEQFVGVLMIQRYPYAGVGIWARFQTVTYQAIVR